jgi:hypothetical protein
MRCPSARSFRLPLPNEATAASYVSVEASLGSRISVSELGQ